MKKSMYPLSAYERDFWRSAFRDMTSIERKRVKQLIRRKRILAIAELWGREAHNPNYWQICTKETNDILLYGSANWSNTPAEYR